MILYHAPGVCSLADHIALHEAGLSFELVKVELKAKRTKAGEDYLTINPKVMSPHRRSIRARRRARTLRSWIGWRIGNRR